MKNPGRCVVTQLILLCGAIACGWLIVLTSVHAQIQNKFKWQESDSHVITGRLLDSDGPIINAEVYLNSLKDKDCVKKFKDGLPDKKNFQKLKACVKDIGPIKPDSQGIYRFSNLSPGYYALVVSWNIKEKFKKPIMYFRKGDFLISYFEGAKYNAVATGKVFQFSGTDVVIKDFDFTKGSITDETAPY